MFQKASVSKCNVCFFENNHLNNHVVTGVKVLRMNQRLPIRTLIDALLGLGTQLRYEAPGDLSVKHW